jgi:hypothetical protein
MKRLIMISLTVLATSFFALSLAQACNDNQFACESEPGGGAEDDCCSCPANETPDDSDGNGIVDGCSEGADVAVVKRDACHGRYDPTDISSVCDNTLLSCCRVPAKQFLDRKNPCHGHELFLDSCPKDGLADRCCVSRRQKT